MVPQSPNVNSADPAFRLVLYSTVVILMAWALYRLKVLVVSLILAVTIASAMAPLAEIAERRKIPRIVTVLLVYLIAALIYGFIATSVAPIAYEQGQKLYENFPEYIQRFTLSCQNLQDLTGNKSATAMANVSDLRMFFGSFINQTVNVTAGLITLVLNGILVLFISGYFVVEADKIWAGLFKWLPAQIRERCMSFIVPIGKRMGGYIRGQLFVAITVSLFFIVGFSLLGIKYAIVLGLLAGLLNLVPYVGSLIASGCAVIVAFNQSPFLGLSVLLMYGIEQWLESSFIVPFFLGREVGLHPLVILVAMISGALLMGVAGVLISIPVISAAIFLAEEFYLKSFVHSDLNKDAAKNCSQSI